jgi:predicted AAA+ superfamily ATPase
MLKRTRHLAALRRLTRQFPVVAILGSRQVGKTTISQLLAPRAVRFDLERADDRAKLTEPLSTLGKLRGTVVLDEVQRLPGIFEALRSLADRRPRPAAFLVLGSASPDLLRQSSESLAGRIAYYHLTGLDLQEVGDSNLDRLWLRGGFPRSFLAKRESESWTWRSQFIDTFLERDIPQLGSRVPAHTLGRFWKMLAHVHGGVFNASEMGRAFGMSDHAVRGYLDLLAATFTVRLLQPWHENISKRQVKSPKAYITDTGLLHALLDIRDLKGLELHPKVGGSWEGFAIAQIQRRLGAADRECFFWGTHSGAELDMLVVRGRERLGFEFKRSEAPVLTPSMRQACKDLKLQHLWVVHPGTHHYALTEGVETVPLTGFIKRGGTRS